VAKKRGRKKVYKTERALRKAIDDYLDSISYREPAVISTPTGEVGEHGQIKYATKMLTDKLDGTGEPRTVTKWLEPPSAPGLRLFLGVSKSTLSNYRSNDELKKAMEYWDDRYEAYLWEQVEKGRHIAGVMFNLKVNFGYSDRVEIGMNKETRAAMSASAMTMEEKLAVLRQAAKDFYDEKEELSA